MVSWRMGRALEGSLAGKSRDHFSILERLLGQHRGEGGLGDEQD